MKPTYVMLGVLAAAAVAASACAPSPAPSAAASGASPAPASEQQATQAPAGGGKGYGNTSAASAPQATQAPTGGGNGYGDASAASPAPAQSGGPSVNVGTNAQLGSILVDGNGMTLYILTKDSPGTSTCYDTCAANWPALLASGQTAAGAGVDAAKLGTTTRTDGKTQVTYNGWPVYLFAKDTQAGQTNGQGVNGVWFVISPSGDAVK